MPLVIFPDKILEFGTKQIQFLTERKLIRPKVNSREFEGDDAAVAVQTLIENPAFMSCDFCKGEPVTTEFPAEDFVAVVTVEETHSSIGSWMACKECSMLVEDKDLDGLVDRAARAVMAGMELKSPQEAVVIDIMLRGYYRSFFEKRTGPGRRV